jgi:hypothetical protein
MNVVYNSIALYTLKCIFLRGIDIKSRSFALIVESLDL